MLNERNWMHNNYTLYVSIYMKFKNWQNLAMGIELTKVVVSPVV